MFWNILNIQLLKFHKAVFDWIRESINYISHERKPFDNPFGIASAKIETFTKEYKPQMGITSEIKDIVPGILIIVVIEQRKDRWL